MGATSTLNGRPVEYDYKAGLWRDAETGEQFSSGFYAHVSLGFAAPVQELLDVIQPHVAGESQADVIAHAVRDYFASKLTGATILTSQREVASAPTCPDCGTAMVKAWMEDEEHNWRCAWLCDCKPPTDGTQEVPE